MAEEQGPAAEAGVDPIALGAAMGRASPAVDAELISYLHDQRHHLHEQLKQIHLDIFEKWLGVALRLATLLVGLAVAGGAIWVVREAYQADGLRVEAFSVPPVMVERGLTGQVVAARVIDRLGELQSQTNTARPARSYSNAWGDKAIKLEIPETGISLGELDSWLRSKVGHETLLTGEVVRNETGVTLTARTGEGGAVSVSGREADMDTLTGKLAEAIYRLTQPYRYATYLMRREGRYGDSLPIFRDLAVNGTPDDRLWSYNMWALATQVVTGDTEVGLRMYRQGVEADPEAIGLYINLASVQINLGLWEDALHTWQDWDTHLHDGKQRYTPANRIPATENQIRARIDQLIGDYHDALVADIPVARTGARGIPRINLITTMIEDHLGAHDLGAVRMVLADLPRDPGDTGNNAVGAVRPDLLLAAAAGDWNRALGLDDAITAYLKTHPHDRRAALIRLAVPLAYAQARLRRFADAERTIAATPDDCYPCLIMRARVAELESQRARADILFDRARRAGPSLPFAFEAEGRALLDRGQPDRAIADFTIADQKSPHFADPLEGWGEALMAKNQSHLALAKFAEAEKYAPNWGRLHLKWGEALAYVGKKDDAKAQFARAAALDLTPSEKSELTSPPKS
jgi:tetratricopeptide (TPR) repeat protein